MFQLEHELHMWKQQISQNEAMRRHDTEELESHLRDSITELVSHGLSDQEAFIVAVHRIGRPDALAQEFGKVNGGHVWAIRLFWMLSGFLLFEVFQLAISAVSSLGQVIVAAAGANGASMGYASAAITILCWLGLAIWLSRRSADGSAGHSMGRFFSASKRKTIGLTILLVVLIAPMIKFGSQISVAKIAGVQEIGEAAWITAWSSAVMSVLIPLMILIVMLAIRSRTRQVIVTGP